MLKTLKQKFHVQVAELYEDLKNRVSQFNMKVPEDTQSLDYTSANREKFILQVRVSLLYITRPDKVLMAIPVITLDYCDSLSLF